MVEDDGGVGKRPGQVGQFRDLRMVQPSIEGQSAPPKFCVSLPKTRLQQQVFRRVGVGIANLRTGVPPGGMANAAKPGTGRHVGFEHVAHGSAEGQVREADDAGTGAHVPVAAAGGHGRYAVDELRLAHGPEGFRPVGTIHGHAFDEHGTDDVVTGVGVRQ